MERFKKLFAGVVMLSTVLSMSMVVAPSVSAAASAGDLIKMNGLSSVYYLAGDGKRYVFPNESTFFSWYGDFSSVKTIAQSELESYPLGANVTVRPGTKLVKITTNPKVYAVISGGKLLAIPDESTASTLYGANWAKRVIDVSDAFFTNYTIDTATVSSTAYPQGSLIKAAAGADVYYIDANGLARKVASEAAFNGNRFKWADVITTTLSIPAAGTDITAAEGTLTDTSSGAGGTANAGTGLSVALASDTPASATVVSDSGSGDGAQALIPALKLNFTAANDGDVKVTTVKVTRGGISADSDIVNMYLYDGETQLASNPSISTKVFTFTNSSGIFTVSKGTTKAITVKYDLVNAATAGITMNFSLAAAADVVTNGAAVSGSFPMTSNTFSSASVTDLGKFTLTNVAPTAASNVDPGNTGYEIWRFTAATQNQEIELRKMKVTIVGSVNVGDLKNLALYDGTTQIGTTVADMASDKTVTFDMTAAPYTVAKGVTRTWSLKADIVGGTTRTFRASIQNGSDLAIYDKGYGVFLKHAGTDSFTIVQPTDGTNAVSYTVSSGSLSVTIATDSPTGNIASSTTGVVLTKATVKATGEDVKIASLVVNCNDATNTAAKVRNLKVLWNGSQVGTTIAVSAVCDGATDNSFTFGSTVIARVGQTNTLSIAADITGDASYGSTSSNDTLAANIETGTGTATGLTSLSSINVTAVSGRTLTIAAGTLSVTKNAAFGDKSSTNPTGVTNGSNTLLASFVITGGAGEDAEVTQMVLGDVSTTYYLSKYFQNIKLMHGTTQLGTTMSSPATGATTAQSHTFNISPAITVTAGSQYVVDIYGDIKSTALETATAVIKANSVTANGKVTGTSASYSTAQTLQKQYITTAGGLTVEVDTDTKLPTNLLMGAVDQELAKFKFTASTSEAVNLTQIVVSGNVSAAATGSIQNLRLFDETGIQIGSAVSGLSDSISTSTYAYAVFNLTPSLVIPKGSSKVITVKADITSYDAGGYTTTGQAVQLAILRDYANTAGAQLPITGTGSSSGTALSSTSLAINAADGTAPLTTLANVSTTQVTANQDYCRANEFVLYRAKLAIAWAGDTPTGASSPSASQTIAKWVVTNAANAGSYVATVKFMNLGLSTTISNAAASTRALNIYKDSTATSALATTTFSYGASASDSFKGTMFGVDTTDGFTDVQISSGSSKTFIATLDTSDAASTKSLSVNIPSSQTGRYPGYSTTGTSYGIEWSDGVTTTIVAHDGILPLAYKTLTY